MNDIVTILSLEDSKRVADALIAAIESARTDMVNRHDAMCARMEGEQYTMCDRMATNHWQAQQR